VDNDLNELVADSRHLIQALDAMFPHRSIGYGESLEVAQRYAGKRELVDFLLDRLKLAEQRTESDGRRSVRRFLKV